MLDNLKNKFLHLFLLFFCLSCNNSQEKSFDQLTNAFFDWYYKTYPVIGSINGIHLYDDLFPIFNKATIINNLDDINRFIIELDQIDPNHLSSELKMDYLILNNEMEKIRIDNYENRIYKQNLIFYLDKILNSIEYIDYSNSNAFDNYISRLKYIKPTLEFAKKSLLNKSYNSLHQDVLNDILLQLKYKKVFFMNENIDIDTLEFYDSRSVENLEIFRNWIEKECNKDSIYISSLDDFNKNLSLILKEKFVFNEEQANIDLAKLNKKMLNIALPIYLLDNDEPIWMNINDTLEVINKVLSNFEINNDFSTFDSFKTSLLKIKDNVNNNHILNISKFDEKKIILSKNASNHYEIFNINYPGKFEKNKFLFLNINNFDINSKYYKNKNSYKSHSQIGLDLNIIQNIFPGEYFLSLSSSNKGIINKSFNNIAFEKGWRKYVQEVVINNVYEYDKSYKLFQYLELTQSIINYIVDSKLNTGKIKKEEAIEIMINFGFYGKFEAHKIVDFILASPGLNSLEYYGYRKIKSIEKEFKKNMGRSFNLKDFNSKLILNSHMNFVNIKERMMN